MMPMRSHARKGCSEYSVLTSPCNAAVCEREGAFRAKAMRHSRRIGSSSRVSEPPARARRRCSRASRACERCPWTGTSRSCTPLSPRGGDRRAGAAPRAPSARSSSRHAPTATASAGVVGDVAVIAVGRVLNLVDVAVEHRAAAADPREIGGAGATHARNPCTSAAPPGPATRGRASERSPRRSAPTSSTPSARRRTRSAAQLLQRRVATAPGRCRG